MVACSKAFLETETSEIEILSLENVFIQIVNGKGCRHLPRNSCRLFSHATVNLLVFLPPEVPLLVTEGVTGSHWDSKAFLV